MPGRHLREKLLELNPDLPVEVYAEAVRQIVANLVSQTLLAANQDIYDPCRDDRLLRSDCTSAFTLRQQPA